MMKYIFYILNYNKITIFNRKKLTVLKVKTGIPMFVKFKKYIW